MHVEKIHLLDIHQREQKMFCLFESSISWYKTNFTILLKQHLFRSPTQTDQKRLFKSLILVVDKHAHGSWDRSIDFLACDFKYIVIINCKSTQQLSSYTVE